MIAGEDVAVVMPTGGGKSLCYQLPAVVSGRTAVVVSPLISLMQDQVAQLELMGIPAALLNSSLTSTEQSRVLQRAKAGELRLLYLSPERLARADSASWLARVPVAYFVIDEAHCISEWGHEFRPEYRQLKALREHFPDIPIAAFTASATRRVRADIVAQLALRDPHKAILSFHRPNLRYIVRECRKLAKGIAEQERLLITVLKRALDADAAGVAIVYAPTIASVGSTIDLLARHGITAIPYHGRMDSDDRRRNQEAWMAEEVRVLVGTVAFGLGINKPGVRVVIHLSMPKSIEQYYQEAGRAGRDGDPADCVLLWQKKDAGLLAHFIELIEDPQEKQRAWTRYREVRGFVEGDQCRHRRICNHFGETTKWETCGMCDVCGPVPDWFAAAPAPAATTPPTPRPPFAGSPPTPPRPAPRLAQPSRTRLMLPIDPAMRERLKEWRRDAAKRNKVPAYIVLHDATIDDLCQRRPTTIDELLETSGIGQRKAELYGEEILAVVNPRG